MDELDLMSSHASDEPLHEFDELVEAADALLTSNGRRPSTIAGITAPAGRLNGFGIDTIAEEAETRTDSNNASPTAAFGLGTRGESGQFTTQASGKELGYSFTSSGGGIYTAPTPTVQIGKMRITEAQAKLYGIYDYETNTVKIPKSEAKVKVSRSRVEALSKPKTVKQAPEMKRQTAPRATTKRRSNEYTEKVHNRPSVADTAIETHRATQLRLEYMRQEEEYNARGKKKICQSCRKEQTFAEVHQRIKMCRTCQAPFVTKAPFNLRRWEERQRQTAKAKDSNSTVDMSSTTSRKPSVPLARTVPARIDRPNNSSGTTTTNSESH